MEWQCYPLEDVMDVNTKVLNKASNNWQLQCYPLEDVMDVNTSVKQGQ